MPEPRTPELVRREIGDEREQLTRALELLRSEATAVKSRVVRSVKRVVAGLVLATGLAAVAALVARRLRR